MKINVLSNENLKTIDKKIDLIAEKKQFKNEKGQIVRYVDYYFNLCGSYFKIRGLDKKFFINNLTSDAFDKIFALNIGEKTVLASFELL